MSPWVHQETHKFRWTRVEGCGDRVQEVGGREQELEGMGEATLKGSVEGQALTREIVFYSAWKNPTHSTATRTLTVKFRKEIIIPITAR